jgi:hypothetical protein
MSGVDHVEWTTADYRALADDDEWLQASGPFDWVFMCRLLGNMSCFEIEEVESSALALSAFPKDCLPHRCLLPRLGPKGPQHLQVSTSRRLANWGSVLPQLSLRDYFNGLLIAHAGHLDAVVGDAWCLPVRRYNPAALITPSGRSVLNQLLGACSAVLIEDVDLESRHLLEHRRYFGLLGTSAVQCGDDGVRTSARYFVVGSPQLIRALRGDVLW